MNIVVSSSRGVGLSEHLPTGTWVSIAEGGKLKSLLETAKEMLPPPHGLSRRYHVYFLCGVPDITRLIKKYSEHYRECVYDEDPSATADRYHAELGDCQKEILKCGALPIFCSITKVNIAKYNLSCLLTNKTSTLRLTDQYQHMQSNLNQTIDTINNHIYTLNKKIGVSTPFLQHTISERRGKKSHRFYIQKWELLYDGLHTSDTLRPIWGKVLTKAMSLNDNLEDSEEEETVKRPWLPSSSGRSGAE